MKNIVPYTKEIPFDSKLAEICSISLEHELNIKENEIEGNFIVSGEYKSHEVSVNKEEFTYKLPFSVDVTDRIDKDSIEFEITDFTYEIVNDSTLKVDIEFSVSALELEDIVEDSETEITREAIYEEVNELFNNEDIIEENNTEIEVIPESKEEPTEELAEENVRLDGESADLILNSATEKENEYTTYNIHLVKPGDTLESIISTYQTDLETIKRYNTMDSLNIGDKIIIPATNE